MNFAGVDGTLRNARVVPCGNGSLAIGRIYDDRKERFRDGEQVRTSRILEGPDANGIIRTRNSVYRIELAVGEQDPEAEGKIAAAPSRSNDAEYPPISTPVSELGLVRKCPPGFVERAAVDRRVTELLEANNREVERRREAERRARMWQETAAQFCTNESYYRDLLDQIGAHIGEAAFTADDGSKPGGVVRAKLPELVADLWRQAHHVE